jgi:hypothetical protein
MKKLIGLLVLVELEQNVQLFRPFSESKKSKFIDLKLNSRDVHEMKVVIRMVQ